MNKKQSNVVCIPISLPISMINEFRRVFDIDKEISDKELMKIILDKIINRYFSPEYFAEDFFENL